MGFLKFDWGCKKDRPKKVKSLDTKPANAKDTKPCDVTIMSHTDRVKALNDEITEKLKKWKIFDIDVKDNEFFLKIFSDLVEKRNLTWSDPDMPTYEGKRTIVVAVHGESFEQHEKDR